MARNAIKSDFRSSKMGGGGASQWPACKPFGDIHSICPVCVSVCVCVCLSVCLYVCPANILVFYVSAIRRDVDLKFIKDTYRVILTGNFLMK